MTNFEWTVENEIQLFYAMMNHKPIGINKHFQMMAIHDHLTSSLHCELYTEVIWKKLETLYDLQALDDSDKLPFPNNEEEFCLPQDSFSSLIEDRLHHNTDDSVEDNRSRIKNSSSNDGTSTPILKRDKIRDSNDDEDEKDAPRRSLKRGRDSSTKASSSPASIKRRR